MEGAHNENDGGMLFGIRKVLTEQESSDNARLSFLSSCIVGRNNVRPASSTRTVHLN